jgi:hypothetical protein
VSNVISVRDVEDAAARGEQRLAITAGTVVTPAARDRARDLHVELGSGPTPSAPPASLRSLPSGVPSNSMGVVRAAGSAAGPGPAVGIIQGRIVGTPEIQAAVDAGLKQVSVAPGTWVTRAARHLAEQAGLAIDTGGRTDGALVNPLQAGGAVTRTGPGVVAGGGIPIGGDHESGTLPQVPLPKAASTPSPSTWSNTP